MARHALDADGLLLEYPAWLDAAVADPFQDLSFSRRAHAKSREVGRWQSLVAPSSRSDISLGRLWLEILLGNSYREDLVLSMLIGVVLHAQLLGKGQLAFGTRGIFLLETSSSFR